MLFVQGEADQTVLSGAAKALFQAAPQAKDMFTVPGAGAGAAHSTSPDV